jgi:hypothetical protein
MPWDQWARIGSAMTSASLHCTEIHAQSLFVPTCRCCCGHWCIQLISDTELIPEWIAYQLEVQWQPFCHANCRDWDHSDWQVRCQPPCPGLETIRSHWITLANAPLLEGSLLQSIHRIVIKSTYYFHVRINYKNHQCIPPPALFSERNLCRWRTSIDGRRCESCIRNRWINHWIMQFS